MTQLPQLEIRDTGKYGKGVFTCEDIRKGETIHVLGGEIISFDECIERIKSGVENQADSLQVDLEMDMDLDDFSRCINHSCDPSGGLRGVSELVALRDIKKGEEITFDYSATIGPNIPADLWTMTCACGTTRCRKTIGNVLTIPPLQLQEYKDAGALQDYILKELEIIQTNGGRLPDYPVYRI
jgi:SET domain-containing protein